MYAFNSFPDSSYYSGVKGFHLYFFQFLSGFQTSGSICSNVVGICVLSIPFRIPDQKYWGEESEAETFNSFPDSSVPLTEVWHITDIYLFQFLSGFQERCVH